LTRLLSVVIAEYHLSPAELMALPLAAAVRYLYCVKEKYQSDTEAQAQANADIIGGLDYGDNAITGWIEDGRH